MNNVIRHSLAAAATVPVSIGVGLGAYVAGAVFGEGLLHQSIALRAFSDSTLFISGSSAVAGGALSGALAGGASLAMPSEKRSRFIAQGAAVPVIGAVVSGVAYGALLRPMGIAGVLCWFGAHTLINVLGTAAVITALWKQRGYNPISVGFGALAGLIAFSATYLSLGAAGGAIVAGAIGAGLVSAALIAGSIQAIHELLQLSK